MTHRDLAPSRRSFSRGLCMLGGSVLVLPIAAHAAEARPKAPANLPSDYKELAALPATPDGRVLVADSLSYLSLKDGMSPELRVTPADVVVGSSFAGLQTFAVPLSLGAKGVIAHAAGVGKDAAGIEGLRMADTFGVAAAACETMSARMSDGRSLYEDGRVGHVNETAARLGVRIGDPVAVAAYAMLKAKAGEARTLSAESGSHVSGEITLMKRTSSGAIYATWFIALVKKPSPDDVFVTGTHCGRTMAEYAIKVGPKGIIANDAGICRDRSGLVGLDILETVQIPGAAVAAMSARIGDGLSTYREGVVSEANRPARERGVRPGMSAAEAADRMLGA